VRRAGVGTSSAAAPHFFRSGSALLPQRFRTSSAPLPHFFRSGSSLLSHFFRKTAAGMEENPHLASGATMAPLVRHQKTRGCLSLIQCCPAIARAMAF